jgi:hypothetical protein
VGSVGFEGSLLSNSPNFVTLEHAKQAAAMCEYLESHTRRVYSCIVTPQLRAARELADKIRRRKVGTSGSFSCRDVYLKGWSGLDSPETVKLAAEILQDAGWVRELRCESGPSGGRPSNREYGNEYRRSNLSEGEPGVNWNSKLGILADPAAIEPTKPSNPGSVGFEGGTPGRTLEGPGPDAEQNGKARGAVDWADW